MSDIDLMNKIKDENSKDFEKLTKAKSINEKIFLIESIIQKDNTEEKYLFELLKLKKESKDINLNKLLKTYEVGITKGKFNKNFEGFIKKSAYEKLIEVFEILNNIHSKPNYHEKIIELIKIFEIENIKYNQTFPIKYTVNKELFFNSLVYLLIKQIRKDLLKPKSNLKECELKTLLYSYQLKIEMEESMNVNFINELSFGGGIEIIKNDIINNLDFNYIGALTEFIGAVYLKFKARFQKTGIFINEYYSENEKEDIDLFKDFIYFLKNLRFVKDDIITHKQIWEETFEPKDLVVQYDNSNNFDLIINQINNKLIITQYDNVFIIPDINNYTSPLIPEIKKGINKLDIFKITKYLKQDKLDSNIFIKKHWNELLDYISDILTSPTIKSVFKKLYKSNLLFPNKEDIKKIMNNIRFFSYKTDSVAETKKKFLSIYMETNVKVSEKNVHIKKHVYLAVFLIACIHEIIGHLYLIIHNYLYHGKNIILSQKPSKLMTDYAKIKGKDPREFIEEQLFGNYGFEMNTNEILYILDKDNYNEVNHVNFRKKFEVVGDKSTLKLSDGLKNILKLYEIDLTELEYLGNSTKFVVNKSKIKNKIKFPQHHSLSKLK